MSNIYPWHKQQLEFIQNLIKEHRLPKVILLYGPQGVGKAKFAESVALTIGSGNIAKLDANQEDSLKIDDIRQLISNNTTKEFNGLSRINLIFNSEKLTEAAANALLKILEDNLSSYFILTVTDLSRVKPTVLSRCFKVNMSIQQDSQLVSAQQWLLHNGHDQSSHELLLALTNNAPLQADTIAKEGYTQTLQDVTEIIQELNSKNIISCKTKLLSVLKSQESVSNHKPHSNKSQDNKPQSNKSTNMVKCHSTKFINMLYYLLNTSLVHKYNQNKIQLINQLMISLKKDLDRGLALDIENLIFRLLYQLAGDHE